MSRRAFVSGGVAGILAASGLTAAEIYRARYVLPYRPVLERVDLPLPPDKSGLAGMRIGFITDTHVGPFISPGDLHRATQLLLDEEPDLILMGGDYVSESPRYAPDTAAVLADLISATPLGGYGVIGNHDLAVSPTRVQEALEREGIPVLRNQAAAVEYRGSTLYIGGIDETLLGDDDPVATFAQIPDGEVGLALWHEPEFAELAALVGAFAQLSGHTHGGQVRLPGLGPLGLPVHGKRYVIGMDTADGMPVYTSRGVGVYRPPVRFNCPPEVTLITLTSHPLEW
jgi:predicted MPP superfamily phosphohydrolase